jgi:hypothetical protein
MSLSRLANRPRNARDKSADPGHAWGQRMAWRSAGELDVVDRLALFRGVVEQKSSKSVH